MDPQVQRGIIDRLLSLEQGSSKIRLAEVVSVNPTTITFDDGVTSVTAVAAVPVKVDNRVVVLMQGVTPPLVIANLSSNSLGTFFGPSATAVIATSAVGAANRMEYQEVHIPVRTLVTGIRYWVGATASGNVRSGLFDAAGQRVGYRSTDSAQSGAGAFGDHPVAFDSAVVVDPGTYFYALQFSSSTATRYNAGTSGRAGTSNPGAMGIPSSITVPTGMQVQVLASTY
jgi:hypothetical protein